MSSDNGVVQTQTDPSVSKRRGHNSKKWTSHALFKLFKEFRINKKYSELIEFLTENFPNNVKNKTFNFLATGHMFHSLHAYVPSVSDLVKERKQIRLQTEYLAKLINSTINDFKLYTELYEFMEQHGSDNCCPCQLLHKSLSNTKNYVLNLNCKLFDIKPPKFKKEPFDYILYKYSLNYKTLLLKKKEKHTNVACARKKKIKHRQMLNDTIIYLHSNKDKSKLLDLNGLSLQSCKHSFVMIESQTRAGDEIVSFIRCCRLCGLSSC